MTIGGPKIQRLSAFARRFWFDALVIAALGGGLAAAILHQHKKDGPQGPLWFDVLAVFFFTLPLLARRRFPLGAPIACVVAMFASSFVDGRLPGDDIAVFLVSIAVAVLLGMRPRRWQGIAGLLFVLGLIAIGFHNDPKGKVGDFAWFASVLSIAWLIGLGVSSKFREAEEAREQARRAELAREEQARIAVEEERARIARELHDVVGHSVSVMTVQASAVRRLLEPDQEKEREALLVVEQTGREALAEMRRMVGVLRRAEETAQAPTPEPSLEHA
jgi:signal transduction histidine kinase